MKQLTAYLQERFHFPMEELVLIDQYFTSEKKKRKEYLVKEGEISADLFFIFEGYTRTFYRTDDGEEITTEILRKGDTMCSMCGFLNESPSFEYMECITDCHVYKISKKSLEKLSAMNSRWLQMNIVFLETTLLKKEERILSFAKLNANERYIKLVTERPDIVQNIPGKYIASYIGIKPESLSRIKNKEVIPNYFKK
jgi:CRP-like cAMP-binding protein